jgi:hypothetical protein
MARNAAKSLRFRNMIFAQAVMSSGKDFIEMPGGIPKS